VVAIRRSLVPSSIAIALVGWLAATPASAQSAADLSRQMAELYDAGRYAEAVPLAERYAELIKARHGEYHPEHAMALHNWSELLIRSGRLAEAEPLMRRVLAIDAADAGPEHPNIATGLNNLALLLKELNRLVEAEQLVRQALPIDEKSLGPDHPNVSRDIDNLAMLVLLQGTSRFADAEPLLRRALATGEKNLGPDHPEVGVRARLLAQTLEAVGRPADAAPLMRRVLAIDEKSLGPDHANVVKDLGDLAYLLGTIGRHGEAEPLLRRVLAANEKSLGRDHPTVAKDNSNLGRILQTIGRPTEAEPFFARALAINEAHFGPEHDAVAEDLNNLGQLLTAINRSDKAEPLLRRSIAIHEKNAGPNNPVVAASLTNLAELLRLANRLAEAEPLYRRALAIIGPKWGPDAAMMAHNLALLLQETNQLAEAELLMRRALAIDEERFGPDHASVGRGINNLAQLLRLAGRTAEAESLHRRALAINEKTLGPEHSAVANSLSNLALLLIEETRRLDEAEPLLRRALNIMEKSLEPEHPQVALIVANLASLLLEMNRPAEAEPLMRRALASEEKSLGPEHPSVARELGNLAALLWDTGRRPEAEPLMRRALAIFEKSLGPAHPRVAMALDNLALLRAEQGDWAQSAELYRRSKPITTAARKDERAGDESSFAKAALVAHAYELRASARSIARAGGIGAEEESFEVAQWALQTNAADALSQMAVRFAKGAGPLAALVRERQDLLARRHMEDRHLLATLGQADAGANVNGRNALAALDAKLDSIDKRLAGEFQEYTALAAPRPLTIAATQALLATDEALVLFLDIPRLRGIAEESLVFVVTRNASRQLSVPLGTRMLKQGVAALRCGLDEEEWEGTTKASECGQLLQLADMPDGSQPLPFHLGLAYELYRFLFAPFEDLIKHKRLLIVPSGPLTSLPFHVLVTQRPETLVPTTFEGYRNVAWFGRSHAMTVLPSVASLKALREQLTRSSKAPDDYFGIGNPVLSGADAACRTSKVPDRCPSIGSAPGNGQSVVSTSGRATIRGRGGRRSNDLDKVYAKGAVGAAVLQQVRSLCPLPDTAYELSCVAERFKAGRRAIRLAASANEMDLKQLSANGTLGRYRIVHFATHGLLAGDVEVLAKRHGEPALVLTPPEHPMDASDDGLLTASEVAQLRLNADWVVLSACNTAGSDGAGAEALSGLARAFFYAGTRALLVSHWPVYSDAAVSLTTRAFAELERNPKAGRAEALQRAMLELMGDPTQASNAHPAVWAPFVVVGEGGAGESPLTSSSGAAPSAGAAPRGPTVGAQQGRR